MIDIFKTTEKTRDELVKEQAERVAMENLNTLNFLKTRVKISFDLVWNNPIATPQEIFDSFGTNASKLFQTAGKTIEFIKSFDPSYEPPISNKTYTINEDGTVTIEE